MNTTFLAILAGVAFGAWPIVMHQSNLGGTAMLVFLNIIIIGMTLPFMLSKPLEFGSVDWRWAIAASVIAGIGMLAFTDMLPRTTPATLGTLYMIVLLVQFTFPLVYRMVMGGRMSTTQIAGILLASAAVVLLAWPQSAAEAQP